MNVKEFLRRVNFFPRNLNSRGIETTPMPTQVKRKAETSDTLAL